MADTPKDQDELTEEETAKRRDEALRRALKIPPKPRKPRHRTVPEVPEPKKSQPPEKP